MTLLETLLVALAVLAIGYALLHIWFIYLASQQAEDDRHVDIDAGLCEPEAFVVDVPAADPPSGHAVGCRVGRCARACRAARVAVR